MLGDGHSAVTDTIGEHRLLDHVGIEAVASIRRVRVI
jgi:hypothetical protein